MDRDSVYLRVCSSIPQWLAEQVPAASSVSVLHGHPDKQEREGMWISSLCLLLKLSALHCKHLL